MTRMWFNPLLDEKGKPKPWTFDGEIVWKIPAE